MSSILSKLDGTKARITKRAETLAKVAPTKDQPKNGPDEWTRLRYSAMFSQYKECVLDLVSLLDMMETVLNHNALLSNEIYLLKLRCDKLEKPEPEVEVYDGEIPPEEEISQTPPEPEPLVLNESAQVSIEVPVQELDLLS